MKLCLAALILCLGLAGCAGRTATRTESILADITTLTAAVQIFGPFTSQNTLDAGRTRTVWEFSHIFQAPAMEQERDIIVGYDRDGYPVFRTITVYTPPHQELQNCRIDVLAEPDGRIIQASSRGNSCDRLLMPEGREAVKTPR